MGRVGIATLKVRHDILVLVAALRKRFDVDHVGCHFFAQIMRVVRCANTHDVLYCRSKERIRLDTFVAHLKDHMLYG